MRSDDIFSADSKIADRLSKEYPVLDDERKERLYTMSKRKYNINDIIEKDAVEVSGVEKYRRPAWYKGVSIAAAAVLLIGGIGGSMYFISRNGSAPAAEVEEIVPETTEALTEEVTEAVTEKQTDAEEVDKDAVAKELIDACRELMCDLHGGNLEVDKTNTVIKTVTSPDGFEYQREYYLVTDTRYPTWADIEKRCFEIFDENFGQVILENSLCDREEEIKHDTFIFTTDNGYYIEKDIHDAGDGPFSGKLDYISEDMDENGNMIVVFTETMENENAPDSVLETRFTITNTENGWRISKADEKLYGVPESDNYEENIQ